MKKSLTGRRRAILLASVFALLALSTPVASADSFDASVWSGRKVDAGEHTNVAVLDLPDSPLVGECTGTVIHPRWVLTAAHCLEGLAAAPIDVGLDGTDVNDREVGFGEVHRKQRLHAIHPNYRPRTVQFDFGLVRLTEASTQPPVRLTTRDDDALWRRGVDALIVGWGSVNGNGAGIGTLREGTTTLSSDNACGRIYGNYDAASMLCAEAVDSDACQGDSGGPLFAVSEEDGLVQVGVTSFGEACDQSIAGVYSFVPAALDWIESTIAAGKVPKVRTHMSGRISEPRIDRGDRVFMAAIVLNVADGAELIRQNVTLQRRPVGTGTWKTVDRKFTKRSGKAEFVDRPRKDMRYRFVHRATAATTGSNLAFTVRVR